MSDRKFVSGLFNSRTAADAAVDAILKRGYTREEISVLMSDATKNKEFALQTKSQAAGGAGIGGAIGVAVGATLAAIVAIGTAITIPPLGLVIAGPIAAALAGAGAGGTTGGLIGALIGLGITKHQAEVYDTGVREGGILIGVDARSDDEVDNLERMFEDLGAKHIHNE